MKNEQSDLKTTPAAETAATVAAEAAPPKKSAKKRPVKAGKARPGTKKASILKLLQRPQGGTLPELAKATGWQAHSVRGFLSGVVGKKLGLQLRVIDRAGVRAYQVKS